ncbi:hypothetical protein Dvina_24715 [Dactylosporangium vinaceum]|uniref:Condensation domain-containing protein n=1 Tax=Dactylosporangium vinaceum TaxID=53362 RepID=A0ABV5MCN5_9ACTN|nr:hypothetical protein [Dactylosporangium vinaceum]UAC00969.1 hypothetical protein Dvina_24715 [Dactylosporangium vinaceum]
MTWQFNGCIGHGVAERVWTIEPALDPALVRRAWLQTLAKHPALTVRYSLGRDGFWRQTPQSLDVCDSFVVDAPYVDNTTRGLIKRYTDPLQGRVTSLIIDTQADRTVVHMYIDHIPLDGYSMRTIIETFSGYLSGAQYRGERDMRFFEHCRTYGATPQTSGPLPPHAPITPYDPVPRSEGPLRDEPIAVVRRFKLPMAGLSREDRVNVAGIGPAIGAAAIARAAGGGVDEVPTLVTVPGRRTDTLGAVGRFLGYVMIGLPSDDKDLSAVARRIYGRILNAAKPRTPVPMSRIVAARAPHRTASKYKQPEQMLPYMAIDHSQREPDLVAGEHRTRLDVAGPELYLGAAAVYTGIADDNLAITVGIRLDHLNPVVFDHVDELIGEFLAQSGPRPGAN